MCIKDGHSLVDTLLTLFTALVNVCYASTKYRAHLNIPRTI